MPLTKRNSWADARSSFKRDQRQAIATAAIELLVEQGSAELTMSTVAERAGISRQTLYRYFPDLASVLAASVEGLETADAQLRSWVREVADPREQLHRCVDAIIDASGEHGASMDELLTALPPQARDGIHAHQARTAALFEEILAELRDDASSYYSGDPSIDAPLILGLVAATTHSSRERAHEFIDELTN